jgi:hypothetical protein
MLSRTPATIAIVLRHLRTLLAATLLLAIPLLQPASAKEPIDGSHVRTGELPLRGAIANGIEQSMLFRRLVVRLDASNVIVYVASDCSMTSLVGRLTFMSSAGPRRYVMVRIACGLTPWQEIATLGHELRHAVEIAEDLSVVDQASLAALYERSGFASSLFRAGAGYDSQVAIEAGRRVWDELSRAAAE